MHRLPTALALLSVALIAFQLALMQLLAIVQWHHFAYMIISVALLGFGASGTVISLGRQWFLRRFGLLVPLLMFASGISMPAAAFMSQLDGARFDSYVLFVDASEFGSLVATYFLFFIPFFLGALAVGLILVRFAREAGRYYFANLLGSGLGALAGILFMWLVPPVRSPALLGLVAVAAGMIIMPRRFRLWLVPTGVVAVVGCLLFAAFPPRLELSEYKDLSRTLELPDAEILTTRSSPYGLVHVVSAPALRYAPGLSLAYQGDVPVRGAVFNNGNWFGPVTAWSRTDTVHLLDYSTAALPYALRSPRDVLVLQAGTGDMAAHALANGATHVVAVEPHQSVLSLLRGDLARESDSLLYDPRISAMGMEPRTYLAASARSYDVITLPTLGAFGGPIGLQALQEQYVLTIEALEEMWDRLSDDGTIAVTTWVDHPYRSPLRALSTISSMLRSTGIDQPERHVASVRSWGTITFVAKRSPLTTNDAAAVRAFSERLSFDPAILPDLREDERMRFNALPDATLFDAFDQVLAGDVDFMRTYDFKIAPATDDRPYFSQFLKWRTIPRLIDEHGAATFPFIELGSLIAGATFVQIFLAALLLILIPLAGIGWRGRGKAWTLLYFSGLGVGFMFVEIVLIQRFVLYLGHPIYATASVLAGVLIFSGVGSLMSEHLQVKRTTLTIAAGCVSLSLLAYAFALMPVLHGTIALPLALKAVLSIPIIGLPAVLMGMPFPLGLRYLAATQRSHLPWAWAINGSLSVVSAALAALLAVEAGFFVVMLVAVASYALVAIASLLRA